MSLTDLAAIASVFSSAAVAVTLVYLAWQLRQAAKHQRGTIGHGRTERVQHLVGYVADPAFMETVTRGWAGDATLEPVRVNQFYWFAYGVVVTFEDTFHQFRRGMVEPVVFETACAQMRFQASQPGMRAAWRMMRGTFEPGFAGYVDGIMRETPAAAPRDMAAEWKAQVAGERAG